METNGVTVRAIVGEDIEPTVFALVEFPESIRYLIKPGFAFNWHCREGVFSITLPGDDPAG